MDAVRYIVEYDRMCRSFSDCRDCPIRARAPFPSSCQQFRVNNPEETVAIVEAWAKEHPQRTRLQDFLEKFPNASLGSSGTPRFLPRPFGYCGRETCQGCDHWGSSDCWTLPVEE